MSDSPDHPRLNPDDLIDALAANGISIISVYHHEEVGIFIAHARIPIHPNSKLELSVDDKTGKILKIKLEVSNLQVSPNRSNIYELSTRINRLLRDLHFLA